jgi:hypothetical protein
MRTTAFAGYRIAAVLLDNDQLRMSLEEAWTYSLVQARCSRARTGVTVSHARIALSS